MEAGRNETRTTLPVCKLQINKSSMTFTATIEITTPPSPDTEENNRKLILEYLKYKGLVKVELKEVL